MYRVVAGSVMWADGGYKPHPSVRPGLAGARNIAPNPPVGMQIQ